jgi:hypothetical protein
LKGGFRDDLLLTSSSITPFKGELNLSGFLIDEPVCMEVSGEMVRCKILGNHFGLIEPLEKSLKFGKVPFGRSGFQTSLVIFIKTGEQIDNRGLSVRGGSSEYLL